MLKWVCQSPFVVGSKRNIVWLATEAEPGAISTYAVAPPEQSAARS
jgi:hypothetical protein